MILVTANLLCHMADPITGHDALFYIAKTKNGILIFTNADEGYKVYEKLILQYLGKQGRKIVDIEMKK